MSPFEGWAAQRDCSISPVPSLLRQPSAGYAPNVLFSISTAKPGAGGCLMTFFWPGAALLHAVAAAAQRGPLIPPRWAVRVELCGSEILSPPSTCGGRSRSAGKEGACLRLSCCLDTRAAESPGPGRPQWCRACRRIREPSTCKEHTTFLVIFKKLFAC